MAEVYMSDIMGARRGGPQFGSQNVRFDYIIEPDPVATAKELRPVHQEVLMLYVISRSGEVTPVKPTERHLKEYAEAYQHFLDKNETPAHGTLLKEWTMMPRSVVADFAHFKIKTVEQVAELDEELKMQVGSLGEWVPRAADWLKAAKAPKNEIVKLREENEKIRLKNRKLEDQLNILLRRVDSYEGTGLAGVSA